MTHRAADEVCRSNYRFGRYISLFPDDAHFGLTLDLVVINMKGHSSVKDLRVLVDNMGDMIRRLGPDGTYLYVSPSGRRL